MKKCFDPVIDENTELVFLGSFPGEESLKKQQYYGHPRNQFWRLVSSIIDINLESLSYEERLQVMLNNKMGIWDVIGKCNRKGSLDSNIKDAKHNNLSIIKNLGPNVKFVCMNGKTAGKFQKELEAMGFKTEVLMSSSPAYTISFEEKKKDWKNKIAIFSI